MSSPAHWGTARQYALTFRLHTTIEKTLFSLSANFVFCHLSIFLAPLNWAFKLGINWKRWGHKKDFFFFLIKGKWMCLVNGCRWEHERVLVNSNQKAGRALFCSLGVYNSIKENQATVLISLLKAVNVVRNDIEWVSQKVPG